MTQCNLRHVDFGKTPDAPLAEDPVFFIQMDRGEILLRQRVNIIFIRPLHIHLIRLIRAENELNQRAVGVAGLGAQNDLIGAGGGGQAEPLQIGHGIVVFDKFSDAKLGERLGSGFGHLPRSPSGIHRLEEISVGLRLTQLADQEFDRIHSSHRIENSPQDVHFLENIWRNQ